MMRSRSRSRSAAAGGGRRHALGVLCVALLSVVSVAATVTTAPVDAAAPAPHLSIRVIPLPSHLSSTDSGDKYEVFVTNTGDEATSASEPLVIEDVPTSNVTVTSMNGTEWGGERGSLECSPNPTTEPPSCTDPHPVVPDESLRIIARVTAATTSPGETIDALSKVTLREGGTVIATEEVSTPVSNEPAAFGIEDFSFSATNAAGLPETQAAGHPYEQTTTFDFGNDFIPTQEEEFRPHENPRDISVLLPEGFVGNPLAAPTCSPETLERAYEENGERLVPCPRDSRIGFVTLTNGRSGGSTGSKSGEASASWVYNLTPGNGHPAEFGFSFIGYAVVFYADVVYSHGRYRLRVSVPGTPIIDLDGVQLTLFGNPGAADGDNTGNKAFVTNPSDCSAGALSAVLEADSWENPGVWLPPRESVVYPGIEGCDFLQFSPELQVNPEQAPPVTQPRTVYADTPDGYEIQIGVPHAETSWSALSSPEIKSATVTLPAGVSISPSAANGLQGCQASGSNGIDLPTGLGEHGEALHPDEAGEGEAIGADGLSHLTAGHCPSASRIGGVEITTPLLEHPLTGSLYIAQPKCGGAGQPACTEASATNGELYGLYLEAAGSGDVVKLPGNVSANPANGQLIATFGENPEIPVSEIKLNLNGGPRAPLASPQTCGTATTASELEPWSAPITPDANPSSSFEVAGCGASMGFAPAFTAGTIVPEAGVYSPLTLTLARHDGEQDLQSLVATLPTGLLAKLAGVPQCTGAQAAAGACPQASEIGTVTVAAGAGTEPYNVQGHVYLTGPYNNGPFGEVVEVPAVAGPFNLGTVVVRGSIRVNPTTAQASVVSDPFPTILDGVPLRIKSVTATLDRPGFTFNPTNCTPQQLTGTIAAQQGASANVASPFTATGCEALPFKPSFTASTRGNGKTGGNGASLTVKIAAKQGPAVRTGEEEANIAKVDVSLPHALSSRLTTLQKACTEAQFAANPAGCPKESNVGTATVNTPILNNPLTGPAYLVSHGGEAFPDLVLVLQGEGIEIVLTGHTQIKKGITYSRFETVPDAPISSFNLELPEKPFSILGAIQNLCNTNLQMPTEVTAQNGAVENQSTRIATEGCSSSISVVSSKVKKGTLTLSVYAPGAGKVTTSGKGVTDGIKTYSGKEALTFKIKQNKAGKLKTKLKLTYMPSKGKKQTKTLKVSFKK